MGDYNFGPEWFWRLLAILAGVGLIAAIVAMVVGIVWLVNHVHFT